MAGLGLPRTYTCSRYSARHLIPNVSCHLIRDFALVFERYADFTTLLDYLTLSTISALAWYENIPLYSLLSISVYKRYYPFLVMYVSHHLHNGIGETQGYIRHGFLVVTLSSGLTATASDVCIFHSFSKFTNIFKRFLDYKFPNQDRVSARFTTPGR